ncbi:kinesin-like protein KIF3C [Lampris incognitus]|uniref:kinesin-like protein KIF3C n=1 Tax=Lampris incognitus TaxID=2546036 RepID=UPI0024B60456|nr:kinesin-like protein KIF3C [Lampris incognitus]
MNRLTFDPEEDQWKSQPLVPAKSKFSQMKKRPASAVGYKRPISQYAMRAITQGALSRYRAENIMFLELDMSWPSSVSVDRSSEGEPNQSPSLDNSPTQDRAGRLRKSRSWCQAPKSITSSSSNVSLAVCYTAASTAAQ